jgi:hypothetical protein
VETHSTINTRKKKAKWLTKKQVIDKFGDEADEMMECIPKRRHPKCKTIWQWMDVDDQASMTFMKKDC